MSFLKSFHFYLLLFLFTFISIYFILIYFLSFYLFIFLISLSIYYLSSIYLRLLFCHPFSLLSWCRWVKKFDPIFRSIFSRVHNPVYVFVSDFGYQVFVIQSVILITKNYSRICLSLLLLFIIIFTFFPFFFCLKDFAKRERLVAFGLNSPFRTLQELSTFCEF